MTGEPTSTDGRLAARLLAGGVREIFRADVDTLADASDDDLVQLWDAVRPEVLPAADTGFWWEERAEEVGYHLAGELVKLAALRGRTLPEGMLADASRYAQPLGALWAWSSNPHRLDAQQAFEVIVAALPVANDQSGYSECRVVAYHRVLSAHDGLYERLLDARLNLDGERELLEAANAGDIWGWHGFWCCCGLPSCSSCGLLAEPGECRELSCALGAINAKRDAELAHPHAYTLQECAAAWHPDPCAGPVEFRTDHRRHEGQGSWQLRVGPWCERHLLELLPCATPGSSCAGDSVYATDKGEHLCHPHFLAWQGPPPF
jgi:hypothetical protein